LLTVEHGQGVVVVEEKEVRVVLAMLRRLPYSLHPHHIHIPRKVYEERASVQPIVVASGSHSTLHCLHANVAFVVVVAIPAFAARLVFCLFP
jgi:hypothetical protein